MELVDIIPDWLWGAIAGGLISYATTRLLEHRKEKRDRHLISKLVAHELHTWIENMGSKLGLMEVHFDSGGQGGSTALNLEPLGFEEQNSNIGKLNDSVARQIYSFLRSKNTLDTRLDTIVEFAFDQDAFDESYYCEIAKLCLEANEICKDLANRYHNQIAVPPKGIEKKLRAKIDTIERHRQDDQDSIAELISDI